MFYLRNCEHCKQIMNELNIVSDQLANDVNVGLIEGYENISLSNRFGITKYPTFFFFTKGQMYEYNDKRKADFMVSFTQGGYLNAVPIEIPAEKSITMLIRDEIDVIMRDIYYVGITRPKALIAVCALSIGAILIFQVMINCFINLF